MVFGAKLRCLLTKAYRDGAGGTVTEGGYNWLTPGASQPPTSDLLGVPPCHLLLTKLTFQITLSIITSIQ